MKKFPFGGVPTLSEYDAVYYCIGIVDENSPEIYRVNADLTYEFARKAKEAHIKKFIYLSSMAVYNYRDMSPEAEITHDTPANPIKNYGKSKLMGEHKLLELADENFRVYIVRAPSIYGRNTEAYLSWYIGMAKKGICLDTLHKCKRSAIYIDNLSELIYMLAADDATGESVTYVYPQNKEVLSVSEYVEEVSKQSGVKCRMIKAPRFMEGLILKIPRLNAQYRTIAYSEELSAIYDNKYCVVSSAEAIKQTLTG